MRRRLVSIAVFTILLAGCSRSRQPDQASAAPGQSLAVESKPAASPVPVAGPGAAQAAPIGAPAPAPPAEPRGAEPRPAEAVVHTVIVPSGTRIRVRLDQALDTKRNRNGDRFRATLDEPIVAGDHVVVPKGTPFFGRVVRAKRSGRLRGRAVLGLSLDSFKLRGGTYRIATGVYGRTSSAHKKRNLTLIGGGSGVGALVGAAAGGGAGALIGAGVGSVAGTTGAFITGRKNVRLPAETPLVFSLRNTVAVRT